MLFRSGLESIWVIYCDIGPRFLYIFRFSLGRLKMKIAIDCFKLVKGTGKSIGIYNLSVNLVRNLLRYRPSEPVDIYVFGNPRNRDDFDIPGVNFIEITKINPQNKVHAVLWELFVVSSTCRKYGIDRILFPRGFCALFHPAYDIVIIHDLIPFFYHENYPGVLSRLENAYIMNRLIDSAKKSRRIVTISEFSKKDIIRRFGIPEEKIRVIYNGVNEISVPDEKKGSDSPEISLRRPSDCIIALTSPMPHKNASGVLKAYSAYVQRSSDPLRLVIIGLDSVSDQPEALGLESLITCHRFIRSDSDMYRMIGESKAFLFLSLIEGFGFPPIEAMQLGVPVVCSDSSSLPEITADAALLVDPKDPDAVADALIKVTTDQEVSESLIEAGRKNIRRFSWEKQARLYWDVLLP